MVKVCSIEAGNTLGSHLEFLRRLARNTPIEPASEEDCDVTITFCPIVSRVGTDIEAAMKHIPATRTGVLVVLHPTFDPEYVVPDTRRFVTRLDILTVDCLFHDGELLNCNRNEKAFETVHNHLKSFHTEIIPRPQPHDQERPSCLDITQHRKYVVVGVVATAIVCVVIAIILFLTST